MFTPILAHVNENEKKKTKTKKTSRIKKKEKKRMKKYGLGIWWTGSFCHNLSLIRLTVVEKMAFYGQTDNGHHVTTVALLCSSTKQSS